MSLAIVKYNAGNICSVINALHRLGVEPVVTDNPTALQSADHVIFPGQGEASSAMAYLRERGLDTVIKNLTKPVLGICVGQQLLCRHSDEGNVDCLGIFSTDVHRFLPQPGYKVPAMGWNRIETTRDVPLTAGLGDSPFVYFVHSYYCPLCSDTIATADYTLPFSAAMQRDNFFATQFHPEKSGTVGEAILRKFLSL